MDIVKTIVKEGDLIIRDLGYHTIESFSAIQDKSAYFLSRLSLSKKIIDLDGGEIDLLSFARKHAPRAGDCCAVALSTVGTGELNRHFLPWGFCVKRFVSTRCQFEQ